MDRNGFLSHLTRLAQPVLAAGAARKLRETMTVEERPGAGRAEFTCLEAAGRLLCGMAPWLELEAAGPEEAAAQERAREDARALIAGQVDPASPDYAGFERLTRPCSQILVDTAFLAEAVLRAPVQLGEKLPDNVREHLIRAFRQTRKIRPGNNNWLLFSVTVEAALKQLTGEYDCMRVDYGFRQFEQWYAGDGFYQDGPVFAFDYYNSLVIQPMLLEACDTFPELIDAAAAERTRMRARRFGQILERLVAPDGSFFAVGRSIAYRCGAFHLLALLALRHALPVPPGQARAALGAVIGRTLGDASYRADGFLAVGLCGSQPDQGEGYISTGSLYLASAAFLPLGLAADDPFWTSPEAPWTQKRLWNGENLPADHCL